jgi:hypothetical protein
MSVPELPAYWPVLVALGVLLVAFAIYYFLRSRRPGPAELERRRREMIQSTGKMGDATITEWQGSLLSYCYHARGMEYQATQDLEGLEAYLPSDQSGMVGSVGIKYDPRNPANSIVVSEKWSGLRKTSTQRQNHDK